MFGIRHDMARKLVRRIRGESGQGLAEYALILAFIALVCIGALSALGTSLAASSAWTLP